MKTLTKIPLILLVGYFVTAAHGAPFELLLRIDGIQNEINAVKFDMGVMRDAGDPSSGGSGGTIKPQFTPLTVFKFIDEATPELFLAAATGRHFPSATLIVRRLGLRPFTLYRIVLTDVLISGVSNSATATDENGNLLEPVALSYAKIGWTFFLQNPDGSPGGSISRTFDLRTNSSR